ncbi:hypothetical protein I546_1896 [Mycobacterium kansasii 732]|nr:hypothetical protein I546_1896 [Mycobacterium kansasii 732]
MAFRAATAEPAVAKAVAAVLNASGSVMTYAMSSSPGPGDYLATI